MPAFCFWLILCTLGCTGYRKIDGEWSYVTWDEASGRRVRKMGADEESFERLSDPLYAKDKKHVFYKSGIVRDADPSTFELIARNYCKDKNRVYYMNVVISEADPSTFEILQAPYARDANRIFCGTVPMNVRDVSSFDVVQASEGSFAMILSAKAFESSYGEKLPGFTPDKAVVPSAYSKATSGDQYFEGPFEVARSEAMDLSK